jgi:predicted secreted protein
MRYIIKKTLAKELCFIIFLNVALSFFCYDFSIGMVLHQDMGNEKIIIIQKNDNHSEITLQKGDVIQIELEGIGSTGFWWHIDNLDTNLLKLLSEETRALTERKTGAPVLGIWRFKVLGKGYTEIKMDYYRKWEGIKQAKDQFSLKLRIN